MAIYALNLFDLADNDLYRRYSRRSPEAVGKHGGRVVALGRFGETLEGQGDVEPRGVMVLVEWPSREALQAFLSDPEFADLHPLREDGTRNYTCGGYTSTWKTCDPCWSPLTTSTTEARVINSQVRGLSKEDHENRVSTVSFRCNPSLRVRFKTSPGC